MHRLSTHSRDVNYCCFSSCSKVLASVSGDKTVRIWDVEKGAEVDFSPLTGHNYQVSTCAFSPFGTILATGSQDCTVILWNASTGAKINVLKGHRSGIKCCAFSPNSNYLASASSDETICVWDSSTGQLVRTLKGNECNFSTCRFTPDNLYIMSGSSNGDLRLFEVQSGNCRAIVMAHDKGLSGVGVTGCDFSSTFGSAGKILKCDLHLVISQGADLGGGGLLVSRNPSFAILLLFWIVFKTQREKLSYYLCFNAIRKEIVRSLAIFRPQKM